jgi:hypothetical protein
MGHSEGQSETEAKTDNKIARKNVEDSAAPNNRIVQDLVFPSEGWMWEYCRFKYES